jgi:deoxyribonucleoside regulator
LQSELLKLKVSKLYYQKGLSKLEISKKLKISRFIITKLLEKALEDGSVKIIINEPNSSFLELENVLEEKFRIYRAVVVETGYNYDETRVNIGRAATQCLLDMVSDNDVIGIAWGTTIYEMLNFLPISVDKKNIKVVQITGGLSQVSISYDSIKISRQLAEIFKARSYQIHAPAIFDNEETKKLMLSESKIRETMDMFKEINIAITGIGSVLPEPSTVLYREGFIKKEDFKEILKDNPVGNINAYFFNKDGQKCISPIDNKTLDMNIDQLKKIRYVIGVAGGIFKADAIFAALKGKIINIIVTDEETAKAIIDK